MIYSDKAATRELRVSSQQSQQILQVIVDNNLTIISICATILLGRVYTISIGAWTSSVNLLFPDQGSSCLLPAATHAPSLAGAGSSTGGTWEWTLIACCSTLGGACKCCLALIVTSSTWLTLV